MHATGNYALAMRASLGYLQREPGSVMGRKLLAATLIKTGQPKSAIYFLEPVLAADPDVATWLSRDRLTCNWDNRTRRRRSSSARPRRPEKRQPAIRAWCGAPRRGHEAEGIVDLEAAVGLKPDFSGANRLSGHCLDRAKPARPGARGGQRLEAAAPKSAEAQQLKGAVYVARQDDINAEKSFRQALSIDPGYFPAAAALARVLLSRQDSAGARSELEKSLRWIPRISMPCCFSPAWTPAKGKRAEAYQAAVDGGRAPSQGDPGVRGARRRAS
jgi:predicted Zn-dependent protease